MTDLSNMVKVTVTAGAPFTLSRHGFIESLLRMLYGSRSHDERVAFKWLGGLGYSARRGSRRRRLWAEAEGIAARVGHGDEVEPMRIFPDQMMVPLSSVEDVKRMFGGAS